MNLIDAVLIISGMFVVTFGVRFVLFARAHKVVMPDFLERALKFVPVRRVNRDHNTNDIDARSAHQYVFNSILGLLGGIAAFVVVFGGNSKLLTILVGVIVFFCVEIRFFRLSNERKTWKRFFCSISHRNLNTIYLPIKVTILLDQHLSGLTSTMSENVKTR